MRNRLIDFLSNEKFKDIDYIFLTGDICDKGIFNQNTICFLDKIITSTMVQKKNLFITPGNHDLSRNSKRSNIINDIYNDSKPYDTANNLDDIERNILVTSQNIYHQITNKLDINCNKNIHDLYCDDKIVVLSINTSWITNDIKGDIVLGQNVLEKIDLSNCRDQKLKIALTHYPLNWLSEIQRDNLMGFLCKMDFNLLLTGHTHNSKVTKIDGVTCCSCRSLIANVKSVNEYNPGFVYGF